MSCTAQFPAELSLSCIVSLVAEIRNGVTPATIKKALWVSGCLLEKLAPATVPVPSDDEVSISSFVELEDILAAIELHINTVEAAELGEVSAMGTPVSGTQGWEVFIPLILELIKFIIEQRQKKQQPAPDPTPGITKGSSGVVRAPKK